MSKNNTITFKFRSILPSALEFHLWMKSIGLKEKDLCTVQDVRYRNAWRIKLKETGTFEDLVQKTWPMVKIAGYDAEVIPEPSNRRAVKIWYVPDELPLEKIKSVFENFGKIQSVERQYLRAEDPDMFNVQTEIVKVYMMILKPIPNEIEINGFRLLVSHQGQEKICKKCNMTGHIQRNCEFGTNTGQSDGSDMENEDEQNVPEPQPTEEQQDQTVVPETQFELEATGSRVEEANETITDETAEKKQKKGRTRKKTNGVALPDRLTTEVLGPKSDIYARADKHHEMELMSSLLAQDSSALSHGGRSDSSALPPDLQPAQRALSEADILSLLQPTVKGRKNDQSNFMEWTGSDRKRTQSDSTPTSISPTQVPLPTDETDSDPDNLPPTQPRNKNKKKRIHRSTN